MALGALGPWAQGTQGHDQRPPRLTPHGALPMTRLRPLATPFLLLLALGPACSSAKPVADNAGDQAKGDSERESNTAAATPITDQEISGAWAGPWGTLILRPMPGGSVLGAFDRNQGTFVGKVQGNLLTGWWCQAPTRQLEDEDAGMLEATFVRQGTTLLLKGKTRTGFQGPWDDSMDLTLSTVDPSNALLARFDQEELFCTMPPIPSPNDMQEAADDDEAQDGMDESDD